MTEEKEFKKNMPRHIEPFTVENRLAEILRCLKLLESTDGYFSPSLIEDTRERIIYQVLKIWDELP